MVCGGFELANCVHLKNGKESILLKLLLILASTHMKNSNTQITPEYMVLNSLNCLEVPMKNLPVSQLNSVKDSSRHIIFIINSLQLDIQHGALKLGPFQLSVWLVLIYSWITHGKNTLPFNRNR